MISLSLVYRKIVWSNGKKNHAAFLLTLLIMSMTYFSLHTCLLTPILRCFCKWNSNRTHTYHNSNRTYATILIEHTLRWTALATTPSTRWQRAGQLGDQQTNMAAGLKATLRVRHFNVWCCWTTMSGVMTPKTHHWWSKEWKAQSAP